MSFAFGFSGDDIEEDEEDSHEQDVLAGKVSKYTISDPDHQHTKTIPPRWHAFEDLVSPSFLLPHGRSLHIRHENEPEDKSSFGCMSVPAKANGKYCPTNASTFFLT